MRRSIVLTTLALAASTLVLAQPSNAVPPLDEVSADRAAKLKCSTGLVIVKDDGRVRYDVVDNDKVVDSRPSKGKLGFDVQAWGYYDDVDGKKTDVFRLNAVTPKGVRRVSLSFTGNKPIGLGSIRYARQSNFNPRLFADGYGYYAYIVTKKGNLERWTLTRYQNGDLKYAGKVRIGSGYGSLTSLQTTTFFKIKGVTKEVLYATTAEGALRRISVPVKKPARTKVRTLADIGYEGVTELSWSTCNGALDHTSLVAVDPVAGTATWTTIKDSNSRPTTTLRGKLTGGDFTGVTALL